MTSSSATRRVLGDLNVNTPAARVGTPKAIHGKGHGSPLKLGREDHESPAIHTYLREGSACRVEGDVSSLGLAKGSSYVNEGDEKSPKRRKIESTRPDEDAQVSGMPKGDVNLLATEDGFPQGGNLSSGKAAMGSSRGSTPSGSPCSSTFANITIDMNDTQNTVITEPDSIPFAFAAPPTTRSPPVSLSQEEFREKARAIRLRLSLASYKVRTNQINVPMSRLEIRSSPFSQKLPSLPRTASSSSITPRLRTGLPPATSTVHTPNKTHERRPSKLAQESHVDISSSPPPFHTDRSMSPTKDTDGPARESFATPILPRQREGLLNPPQLVSPSGNDLTSSVVKGRAADGLLSLMRQLE